MYNNTPMNKTLTSIVMNATVGLALVHNSFHMDDMFNPCTLVISRILIMYPMNATIPAMSYTAQSVRDISDLW